MSSSIVFTNKDVPRTTDYLSWLAEKWEPIVASMVIALEATKVETLTMGKIYAFLKQEPIQAAFLPA